VKSASRIHLSAPAAVAEKPVNVYVQRNEFQIHVKRAAPAGHRT
jgi:hypothetical protein